MLYLSTLTSITSDVKIATHGHIRPKINPSVFSSRRLNQFDASPANCHIDIKIDLFAGFYQTIEN